jgi:hypothetical protein
MHGRGVLKGAAATLAPAGNTCGQALPAKAGGTHALGQYIMEAEVTVSHRAELAWQVAVPCVCVCARAHVAPLQPRAK